MAGETVITIIGNLTDEPELRTTRNGEAVCNVNIASNTRQYNSQSGQWEDGDTLYMRGTIWRDMAQHCAQSLHKAVCNSVPIRRRTARTAPWLKCKWTKSAPHCGMRPRKCRRFNVAAIRVPHKPVSIILHPMGSNSRNRPVSSPHSLNSWVETLGRRTIIILPTSAVSAATRTSSNPD